MKIAQSILEPFGYIGIPVISENQRHSDVIKRKLEIVFDYWSKRLHTQKDMPRLIAVLKRRANIFGANILETQVWGDMSKSGSFILRFTFDIRGRKSPTKYSPMHTVTFMYEAPIRR